VRLVLVCDNVIPALKDRFLIGIELIELRTTDSLPLKDPELAF